MSTVQEKIKEIEIEMARTQKNKATSFHLGLLKAKLAKLRKEATTSTKGPGGSHEGFDVSKSGIARIGFVGFPSVGKSTLMSKLTGVNSEIAAYEFTTLTAIPGIIQYNGAKLQIIDLPGIIEGAKDGKGKGKQVIGVARSCSLIVICLDVTKPLMHKNIIERELEGAGIRLNKQPPNIKILKKERGGINIVGGKFEPELVKSILCEFRMPNAEVTIQGNPTIDEFIDVVVGNRKYIPVVYALNKIDAISIEELDILSRIPHAVPISAEHNWNFDTLLKKIWQYLNLIRIYPKPKGSPIDYDEPVILKSKKRSITDFCNAIHKAILSKFKYAIVWGTSVKHQKQKVGKDHILNDCDVVQIIKSV
ncbi:GTPase, predicted [Enterocytozoon bieneusi H348]|nr:GTPase, predicted [Enterocytozoon bieneusi H348]|eukprot:XP_002650072.1 GTPase, predicted [Enterocytozoon bieneusi H348]